jgi:hypothetical protein
MVKPLKVGSSHLFPILILILATILAFLYFQNTQSPLTHRGGMGWDGEHYHRIAQQIIDGEPIAGARPLVYRIGAPALAAVAVKLGIAGDIFEGFFQVNATFSIANIFLVYFLISRFVNPWTALVGGVLFPLHWINPARHIFFTPLTTDPGGLFFLYLGLAVLLVLHDRKKSLSFALTIITFIGMPFREFVLVLPVLFALTQYPPRQMMQTIRERAWARIFSVALPLLPPLLGGIASIFLIRYFVEAQSSYAFWKSAMYHFWINSPQYYMFSAFSAFGIAVIFPLLQWRFAFGFVKSQPVMFYFLFIIIAVGFIGGDTNVRYLNWAFPFFFVLIAKSITEEGLPGWAVLGVIAFYIILAGRLPWQTPDYQPGVISPFPIFTYLTDDFRFQDLFVLHAKPNVTGAIFYEYLIACVAITVLIRRRKLLAQLRRWFSHPEDEK